MPNTPEQSTQHSRRDKASPLPPPVITKSTAAPSTRKTAKPSLTSPPQSWILLDEEQPIPTDRLHYLVEQLLSRILEYYVERNSLDASIISNMAIRWDIFHKIVGADPDIALQEPCLTENTKSILLWKKGVRPPKVVVEVVSQKTASTDYLDKPAMYDAAGVNEYWVLDLKKLGPSVDGAGLVVDKRTLKSKMADDQQGTRLWPTKEEHEREEKEIEREAKEAALKELADLKKKLGLTLRTQLGSLGQRRILSIGSL